MNKKGSMTIEMLIYLPILLVIVFYFVYFIFFYLESISLDVATAETAKTLVTMESAEELMVDLLSSQAELAIPNISQTSKWGTSISRLWILYHDESNILEKEAMSHAQIRRQQGEIQVSCDYESQMIRGLNIKSKACERSWE